LGAPEHEARGVLNRLRAAGFVSKTKDQRYAPTEQFIRLKAAKIGAGIRREVAKALLEKVLTKAEEINANPIKYRGAGVKTLAVFGSFLTGTPVLSDLDMAYETWITSKEEHKKAIADVTHGWRSGAMTPVDRIAGFLKCRSPHISMHMMSEVQGLGTPFKLVMEDGRSLGMLD
jgi:hypothetical protein